MGRPARHGVPPQEQCPYRQFDESLRRRPGSPDRALLGGLSAAALDGSVAGPGSGACFERAGLGKLHGVGLHCLRRTWATQALEHGASLDVVQDAGGWASEQVLLRHYARPGATARRKLASRIGAALLEE